MPIQDFTPNGVSINAVPNQSVAAAGSFNSEIIPSDRMRRVRAWFKTKGANSTGKLQGSHDKTTWYDMQTLAAGINAVVEVCDPFMRVNIANAGAGPEVNDVFVYTQA